MRKRVLRSIFAALLAAVMLLTPSAAFAGISDGPIASGSSGAKDFGSYSRIQTNATYAIAYQFTRCTNAKVSPGEIGSIARLFSHGGSLTGSSGWQYNGSIYNPGIAIGPSIITQQPKGTSWYAQGAGQFYSGSGYITLSSGRTLYQTVA